MHDSSWPPRYDVGRDYDWNYEHAPEPIPRAELEAAARRHGLAADARWPGSWSFCGLPTTSPLGLPAGPLLNGRWCLYYASLGFDVLTYKTARSAARACYPPPNLVPVRVDHLPGGALRGGERGLPAAGDMGGSWAVSFGMPSRPPDVWRRDVEQTRRALPAGKVLVVSVVGTARADDSLDALADDYALCARWAVESGADAVEANFSCPNVCSPDGQLYQDPAAARRVAQALRAAVGEKPLIVKIGQVADAPAAAALVEALAGSATALSMTNCLAATVQAADETKPLFDGQPRGVAGAAIRAASVAQTRLFAGLLGGSSGLALIGVGGVATAEHAREYLRAGAHHAQLATAAMLDPLAALRAAARARE